jgi:hypothetical protein
MRYVRVSRRKLNRLCARGNTNLSRVLDKAGVSRNAFYSLARKDCVLPSSIRAIAACLNTRPSDFLEDEDERLAKAHLLLRTMNRIALRCPGVEADAIRHVLVLLDEEPVERLRRALLRAQTTHIR